MTETRRQSQSKTQDQTRDFELTASAFAGRFGITPRALRVYEQAGLLSPRRTQAGWRIYGPRDADRLYQVLALKSLGLGLDRIGAALKSADLSRILAAQEEALETALSETQKGLMLVRAARARLGEGRSLSADDLVILIKETAMNVTQENTKYAALVERHLGATIGELMPPDMTVSEMMALQEEWKAVLELGERLKHGDPGSEEAKEFGRRLGALIYRSARDEDEVARQQAFFEEGFADPDLAAQMPFSRELWEFCKLVRAHIEAEEGAV